MTLPLAILIIVILLIYDAFFLKLLLNKKQRTIFVIYVEDGEITSTEGEIPDDFLLKSKKLCQLHHPGMLKISAKKYHKSSKLEFSGVLTDELQQQLESNYKLMHAE